MLLKQEKPDKKNPSEHPEQLKQPVVPFCICGPDVASIGWIPYFKYITQMPANDYTRHSLFYPAFQVLFDSGNDPPPPVTFSGLTDFFNFLSTENFRGAMYLGDVRLCCDAMGRPTQVSWRRYEEVGYTPMRVVVGRPPIDSKFAVYYSQGVGGGGVQVTWAGNCATITHWLRFKIGGLGNWGSWLMTGQWAPFAWMRTDYKICCDGSITIKFAGTYIPSQYYYVGWNWFGLHDMLGNTTAQIDGFLNAGDCSDAPGIYRFTWRGPGRRC